MSQRFISTSFWDDAWVQDLPPESKLLYMYLLTNPLTNIAGVYKITARRISFDTGIAADKVSSILVDFECSGKAMFVDEYIILPNWPKHQKVNATGVKTGIERILSELPESLILELQRVGYQYPIKGGSTPPEPPLNPPPTPHTKTYTLNSKLIPSGMQNADADLPAAADLVNEVAKALAGCREASRITSHDHETIAGRLNELGLDAGFVSYCIGRTKEANPKNPGGFLRAALFGLNGFADYPEQYKSQSKPVVQSVEPTVPDLKKCPCGEKPKVNKRLGEAFCICGRTWTYDPDFRTWDLDRVEDTG